jgi:hypothetical protein
MTSYFPLSMRPPALLSYARVGPWALACRRLFVPFLGGGGQEGSATSDTEPLIQWGPSVVLIRDHSVICGGQYGKKKNNCFCCAPLAQGAGCPSRHLLSKVSAVTDDAAFRASQLHFHKGSRSNAAYASPYLEVSSMTPGELSSLIGSSFASWEAWREEVGIRTAAVASRQDVSVVRTAVKTSKIIPKLSTFVGMLSGPASELGMDLEERLKLMGTALEDLEKGGDLTKTQPEALEDLLERANLLQAALLEVNEAATNGMKELQVGLAVRLSEVETVLGTFSEQEGDQMRGMSLCAIMEDIQQQLDTIKGSGFVLGLTQQVLNSDGMAKHSEGVREAFRVVMKRIIELEEKVTPREDAATQVQFGNWFRVTDKDNAEEEDKVSCLATRVEILEQSMLPTGKLEGEDIVVSFMGVRFASEDDIRAYVETLNGGSTSVPIGLITDCYSIFHSLNRDIFDTKSKLSMVDLAKVSQLGARQQSDVYNLLAAAEHGLPAFFDSPSLATKPFIDGKQGKKHRFSNLASYEIWGSVGTINNTIRRQAENLLTRLSRTMKVDIKEIKNPDLRTFLMTMLDTSREFVEAVFKFLTEEYAALFEHFADGALCWDFACSCVEHMFKYKFEAARAVVTNPDVGDSNIQYKVLWQSLRTIAIQESFLRVGFKNHSSLASAYSRFLLTQYQKSAQELARVTKESDAYKRKFVELETKLETIDKRMRAAEGTANLTKNALEKLANKRS